VYEESRPSRASRGESVIAFETFGLRIGLRIAAPGYRFEHLRFLPPGATQTACSDFDVEFRQEWRDADDSPVDQAGFHWFNADTFRALAPTVALGVAQLEPILEFHVADHARSHVFMHAGVVVWREVAIIMPGTARAGKTTLVRALVEAGATYFSDEFAVFDEDGHVYSFPRRARQREGPFGPRGRVDLSYRAPTGAWHGVHAPVGLVLLLQYEEGSDWRVEPITPGSAMLAMTPHVSALRRSPARVFTVIQRIAEGAVVVRGVRGDARTAAKRILEAIEAGTGQDLDRSAVIAALLAQHGNAAGSAAG
jgi:hypothetical protein